MAHGLSEEQVELLCSVRPLMAYLIGNVLDSERRERLQGQMRVLGEIAEAFTQAEHADNPLSALATALSRASGFAWVVILVFDPGIERVIDRAINVGRHSNTETAERGRRGEESENSGERDLLGARHMAWTRQPYTVPDVGDPNEQLLVNDELRPYYEQAHILSMASFPVFAKDALMRRSRSAGPSSTPSTKQRWASSARLWRRPDQPCGRSSSTANCARRTNA